MGTNYYVHIRTCNNPEHDNLVHVGKASAGWRFLFNGGVHKTCQEWIEFLADKNIVNEYGAHISVPKFWAMVAVKATEKPHEHEHIVHDNQADVYVKEGVVFS